MKLHLLPIVAALAAGTVHADPFEGADVEAGKKLHAKYCVQCHSRNYGGEDGSDIYIRTDRRVTSPSGLKQQLTTCTTMLNLDLFPEDEQNLAGYLNQRYYHFK